MKKVICNKEYDTNTAQLIHKYTYSHFGDPQGYEKILFQTPEGFYFVYVRGGENSPYPKENIMRLAKTKVSNWLESH